MYKRYNLGKKQDSKFTLPKIFTLSANILRYGRHAHVSRGCV